MKRCFVTLWLLACCVWTSVGAVSVYGPETAGTGSAGLGSLGILDSGMSRFQQVYSSSLFSAYPQGVSILQVVLRGDEQLGGVSQTISNIEIHLSTTTKTVDGLSPVFAENVGVDDRVVRTTAPFLLQTGAGIPPYTKATGFSALVVDLYNTHGTPFLYNPAMGNLLMDIRISAAYPFAGSFDADNRPGDGTSSAYASIIDSDRSIADHVGTIGLDTELILDPIPEPSSWAIGSLGVGLVLLFGGKGIRRKRKPYVTS